MLIHLLTEHFKRTAHQQFSQINKKAYPITTCKLNEAVERAQTFIVENPFEIDVVCLVAG